MAISFFIKKKGKGGALIHYARRPEMETREDKLSFLAANRLSTIPFDTVQPDQKQNWLNLTSNDWDGLVPIADKKSKSWTSRSQDRAIFRLVSNGLQTKRDEWAYDFDRNMLKKKFSWLVDQYETGRRNRQAGGSQIKWDADLSRHLANNVAKTFEENAIIQATYRPFTRSWVYFDRHFNSRVFQLPSMFTAGAKNTIISFSDPGFRSEFCVLAADNIVDLHFGASVDAYQVVSRYRYGAEGSRVENITDWAVEQFSAHYKKAKKPTLSITKDAIFHYVYGVLYDPTYREVYAQNLKREFPRIPFYADFWKWADWGEKLMALHIGYETAEPWPLKRIDTPDEKSRKVELAPKAMVRANKETGNIQLDSETQLTGIPSEAWDYKLGNRSALEWILDQHKEKTPKDPTIREKFNTYRFADYKEGVIDLLKRVTRVSVETMRIVEAMKTEQR